MNDYLDSAYVMKALHERITNAGSQFALAIEIGVSTSYINDVVHGKRRPGKKILNALGLTELRVYIQQDKK